MSEEKKSPGDLKRTAAYSESVFWLGLASLKVCFYDSFLIVGDEIIESAIPFSLWTL